VKYLRLVWSGLWRKRARTIFTLASIVVAFLLFGMLQGVDTSFNQLVDTGRLNVLVTTNPAGLPLPLADLSQIESIHGVTGVTYRSLFIGYYQTLRNFVIVMPIDPDHFFALNSMFAVAPAARAAFLATRTGALITPNLARRMNWRVGEQVPLRALNAQRKDGTSDWTFNIVGTFEIRGSASSDEPVLLMNYPYFDTARAADTGTVQMYMESIADASQAPAVSNAIDNLFANSSNRTHTQTERANAQSQLAQIGDLDFFVDAIVGAAFATLLILTGSTMMQSYRERVREFAVLKTVGFTDGGIAGLVLSEALLLCLAGALAGLVLSQVMLRGLARMTAGVIPVHLPRVVFLAGAAAAVVLALACALPAAWRAKRLSIVEALTVR